MKVAENVGYFFFTLASPLLFYFISALLFPSLDVAQLDFKKHYFKVVPWVFSLFILLMITYFINNIWIKSMPIDSVDNLFSLSGLLFGGLLIRYRQEWFHAVAMISGSIWFAIYVVATAVK